MSYHVIGKKYNNGHNYFAYQPFFKQQEKKQVKDEQRIEVRRALPVYHSKGKRLIASKKLLSKPRAIQERGYKKIIPLVTDDPKIINFGGVDVGKAQARNRYEDERLRLDLEREYYNGDRPRNGVCPYYAGDSRQGIRNQSGSTYDPIGGVFQGIGDLASTVVSLGYQNKSKELGATGSITVDKNGVQSASITGSYAKTVYSKNGTYLCDVYVDATGTRYFQYQGSTGYSLNSNLQVSRTFEIGKGDNKLKLSPYGKVGFTHDSFRGSGTRNCLSGEFGVTGSYNYW